MKERFKKLSPYYQVLLYFLGAAIFFLLFVALAQLVIAQILSPAIIEDTEAFIRLHPIYYMFLHYLPFEIGFLLIPGIIYWKWTKEEKKVVQSPNIRKVVWSILIFICAFLLLPLLSKFNMQITDFFNVSQQLIQEKINTDQLISEVVGPVGSSSFYVALLIVGVLTGIAEELTFRRFLMHHFLKNTNKLGWSLIASSIIFALLHFNYIQILPLFVFGLALGLMYYVSGSIWVGILFHAFNNIINIYWMASETTPSWMSNINLSITIPVTLLTIGLVLYLKKRII